MWCKLGIADCVANISVSQVFLNRPGIYPFSRQIVPATVLEHMGMYRKLKFSPFARLSDHLPSRIRRHRTAPLRDKYVGWIRIIPLQLPKPPYFLGWQRVNARAWTFDPSDVNGCRIKIDLLPAQIHQLRYPQPVPVAHQNQCRVTMSPATFEGNLDHRLHFLLKQILAIADFQIRPGIATSFLRRGIRLFIFQKSAAGGELDDSHVTPKISANILR